MLEPSTVILMLLAGILHASWHSLVKSVSDQLVVAGRDGTGRPAPFFACMLPFLPFPSAPVWVGDRGLGVPSHRLQIRARAAPMRWATSDRPSRSPAALYRCSRWRWRSSFSVNCPRSRQMAGIAAVSLGLIWLAIQSIRGGVDRRIFSRDAAGRARRCRLRGRGFLRYKTGGGKNWLAFAAWSISPNGLLFAGIVYSNQGGQRLLANSMRNAGACSPPACSAFCRFPWCCGR